MNTFADILFAKRADGARVFDDDVVDHALPYVLIMVSYPLDQMPERARQAFVSALAAAQVAAADDVPAMYDKLAAYYLAHPIDQDLFKALMSWMREELRVNRAANEPSPSVVAKLGLGTLQKIPGGDVPADAVPASPLLRLALHKSLPPK